MSSHRRYVQDSNVVKNQPQYCSNVLMKFNCKLEVGSAAS